MQGYKEAEEINEIIRKWEIKYPITKENALNWLNFVRTIETITLIIECLCKEKLFDEKITPCYTKGPTL